MSPASYRAAPPRAILLPSELYVSDSAFMLAGKATERANCVPRRSTRTLGYRRWGLCALGF